MRRMIGGRREAGNRADCWGSLALTTSLRELPVFRRLAVNEVNPSNQTRARVNIRRGGPQHGGLLEDPVSQSTKKSGMNFRFPGVTA